MGAATGSPIFENEAGREFLARLRQTQPTAVGDLVSGALRAVGQAESPLPVDDVQRALVALALLLSEFDPEILAGAPDAAGVQAWFVDLEIELNPARRQIAAAAITRILLPQDNLWLDGLADSPEDRAAPVEVHRLRDLLADSAVGD